MKYAAVIRWAITAVLLVLLTLLVSSPAIAEEAEITLPEGVAPLALDALTYGMPSQPDGWTILNAKEAAQGQKVLKYSSKTREWSVSEKAAEVSEFAPMTYEDPSISVSVEYLTACPAYKAKNIPCSIVRIKVADPSQIRTTMSYENYDQQKFVKAETMAQHVNAIAAVNGDFFKYHYKTGYVLRQGVFYRDKLNGKRDLLIIDQHGDFHSVYAATSENTAAYLADMEAQGLTPINTFTLGPVLVENGVARDIKETITGKKGEFQYRYPQQRVAIVQLGKLEYAIVEAYGKTDSSAGMTLQEMADFITYLFPDCIMAYNLDGGGSTNVVVNGERIHKTPGRRDISDILYFASAYTPVTETENAND